MKARFVKQETVHGELHRVFEMTGVAGHEHPVRVTGSKKPGGLDWTVSVYARTPDGFSWCGHSLRTTGCVPAGRRGRDERILTVALHFLIDRPDWHTIATCSICSARPTSECEILT